MSILPWPAVALVLLAAVVATAGQATDSTSPHPYTIVDTGQRWVFSDAAQLRHSPANGQPFHGQDAHYDGYQPRYRDNGDGTISDFATGLMWTKADNGAAVEWRHALAWAEGLKTTGHTDWRLPNARELQSIVDYTRAPDAEEPARRGPALDPIFRITDEAAWFWSSTTHLDGPNPAARAVYVCFGAATGAMTDWFGNRNLMNVHGAGAQRSDLKADDPRHPRKGTALGPQGDIQRIDNFARAVRNIDPAEIRPGTPDFTPIPYGSFASPER